MSAPINTLNVQGYFVLSGYVLVDSSTCSKGIEVQMPDKSQEGEIF